MKTCLLTSKTQSEFCILARPRDCIKLHTVADGSKRIIKLQVGTSRPSSKICVATIRCTCINIITSSEDNYYQNAIINQNSMTALMANLSSPKRVNNFCMFFSVLLQQTTILSCHMFNNPARHLMNSGKKRCQYNACNNSLNKNNASQILLLSAIEERLE